MSNNYYWFFYLSVIVGVVSYFLTWLLSRIFKFKMFFDRPKGKILSPDEQTALMKEWRTSMWVWFILYVVLFAITFWWMLSAS